MPKRDLLRRIDHKPVKANENITVYGTTTGGVTGVSGPFCVGRKEGARLCMTNSVSGRRGVELFVRDTANVPFVSISVIDGTPNSKELHFGYAEKKGIRFADHTLGFGDVEEHLDLEIDAETLVGVIPAGVIAASGGGDASGITYTPAVNSDWDSDTDPGDVDDALDQLASRVDDLEISGGGTGGRTLISEQTPTGNSVSWTSIPGTYKTLYVEWIARSDTTAVSEGMYCYFNNDTTLTNYRRVRLTGQGASVTVFSTDDCAFATVSADSASANMAGHGWMRIIQYAGTTFNKTALAFSQYRDSTSSIAVQLMTNDWENTAAINRIDIALGSGGNFVSGSTFRLYGEI